MGAYTARATGGGNAPPSTPAASPAGLVYQSAASPMGGGTATLVLPATAADHNVLQFEALWFYGPASAYPVVARSGFSRGEYAPGGSMAQAQDADGAWKHFTQTDLASGSTTWTVGILPFSATAGWSLEYHPGTRTLSLDEYGDTGTGDAGRPNLRTLTVLGF